VLKVSIGLIAGLSMFWQAVDYLLLLSVPLVIACWFVFVVTCKGCPHADAKNTFSKRKYKFIHLQV
jgi:hypothetical protein